nr:hypothetical protein [Tanacetum cinerariifolium]
MAATVISISSDVSVESVGSSFPRVILIGFIYVEVPIAPKVGADVVALPAGVLELDTHSSLEADPSEKVGAAIVASPARVSELEPHSSSKADPSESSPPLVSVAPMVSPFLCSDDSESDTKIPERHVSPTPHDAMLTRWRRRVALRSSSPTTSTLEIHTAPILCAPSAIVVPSSEALIVRKSVRPLHSHRLTLRYTSHHLDSFTSESSSSHSSSYHSSSGHSITGYSLSEHTPPNTTDVDSSTPLRFVHPSLTRTPQSRDSFFESSTGPSRKRCRSSAATVTSSIHATRALVPSRANLLPPRKRFKDSISPEDSVEEDIDTNVLEDIEVDATAIEVAVDRDVEAGVDTSTIEVGVDVVGGIDIPDGMRIPNAVECLEQVEEGLQNIYKHVREIPLQRIEDIETGQRELEAKSLIAGREI